MKYLSTKESKEICDKESQCYHDPITDQLVIVRLYCLNCREETPHIICVPKTDSEEFMRVLKCEKCEKETLINGEKHDQILKEQVF